MNIQCIGGSRSFAKETRALKMRSMVGSHQKLTATNWKPSSKLILLQLHKKLPKTSMSSFLQSFSVWCNWKGEKARLSGSWADQKLEKKKNHCFEVSSSLILHNNEPFLNQIVTCNETWILYNWQTVVEPKSSKASPKAKLGGLLPVWSTTAFWIRAKPLPLRSMFNKSMRCTKNCKACSQNWSTERAQFSMTRPDCISHSQCFKSWRINWATKACLICHTHLSS